MKCPHCLESFFADWQKQTAQWRNSLAKDVDETHWLIGTTRCPNCQRLILALQNFAGNTLMSERLIQPKAIARTSLPPQVPENHATDYREACRVLADSPKASAALSRRCLQHLLREKAKVKPSDLANEIQQVLDLKTLPSYLADALDAVRNIGNFAVHPVKSKSTGEIYDVEPGEAEWNLDTLEGLFDFYFVQPALMKRKQEALNEKLKDAGKPPMKGS